MVPQTIHIDHIGDLHIKQGVGPHINLEGKAVPWGTAKPNDDFHVVISFSHHQPFMDNVLPYANQLCDCLINALADAGYIQNQGYSNSHDCRELVLTFQKRKHDGQDAQWEEFNGIVAATVSQFYRKKRPVNHIRVDVPFALLQDKHLPIKIAVTGRGQASLGGDEFCHIAVDPLRSRYGLSSEHDNIEHAMYEQVRGYAAALYAHLCNALTQKGYRFNSSHEENDVMGIRLLAGRKKTGGTVNEKTLLCDIAEASGQFQRLFISREGKTVATGETMPPETLAMALNSAPGARTTGIA